MEYIPYASKMLEISFGQKQYYDQESYTPTMLADQLEISPAHVEVAMPSEALGWYFIQSVATYLQEAIAAAAAQKIWDQSAILEKFREQKVIRARYGYEEVKTGYCTWLGQCENQDQSWLKPVSRTEHMAHLAMSETLLRALDVNSWRALRNLPFKYISDDELLQVMHKLRAKSRYQSAEARAESTQWLATQAVTEKAGRHT